MSTLVTAEVGLVGGANSSGGGGLTALALVPVWEPPARTRGRAVEPRAVEARAVKAAALRQEVAGRV